ncbi:MAG: DUF1330 domain-containing protein [Burkholderiales bacterium]|nr:DUF1330 domain-containing protein [Burkholderiales bacterium]
MSAYTIVSIRVTDPEKYAAYMALSDAAVAAAGGRFLVRGGNPKVMEGEWPRPRVVVTEFPDRAAAEAFYESALYVKARAEREGAAEFSMIVVDGVGSPT